MSTCGTLYAYRLTSQVFLKGRSYMNSKQPLQQISPCFLEATTLQEKFPGLTAGFTTRNGGESELPYETLNVGLHVGDLEKTVIRNRRTLADVVHYPLSSWIVAEQVHGAKIKKVSKDDAGLGAESLQTAISGTDGIYTKDSDVLLTSLYADCVPLFFIAPNYHTIGLAHAGWKGTVGQIGPEMVKKWTEDEQIPLSDIYVLIGPAISGENYEVNDTVIQAVDRCLTSEMDIPYVNKANGRFNLDLKQLNKSLLIQAGVSETNIEVSEICTLSDERMFSHRGDGGKTGRMMSVIGQR